MPAARSLDARVALRAPLPFAARAGHCGPPLPKVSLRSRRDARAARRDGALGLTLDPQLMRDLTVLISSSVAGGMLLEAVKQPVINGYFIAGSVVGPGGLKLIKARRRARPRRASLPSGPLRSAPAALRSVPLVSPAPA